MKNFKISHGWIYRFKKKYNIISRAQTTASKCQAANKGSATTILQSARKELTNKIKNLVFHYVELETVIKQNLDLNHFQALHLTLRDPNQCQSQL